MSSDDSSSDLSTTQVKKKIKKIPVMDPALKVKPKYKQVVINLSMTKYDVISDVADELDWRVQYSKKKGDWDILWTDNMIEPDTLIKMHFFQKISHFPGIHVLARKNLLGLSFMDMSKKFPRDYNFFPKTWMLPNDYPQLRQQVQNSTNKCFIVKPEADCQGRGIFLTFKTEDVENGKHYVVQEYIQRPFLVQGLKFDFRVYVLLCGTNPMRLFIYGQGLARLATEKYEAPSKNNLKKVYMHLTNYAINKKNPKYIYNSSAKNMSYGHKRSLTSVFKYIERKGLNVKILKQRINDVIIKTVIMGQPLVSHQYKFSQPDDEYRQMCFHILGIDVMIDEKLNPVVIEVNHTPSFATDTPLDYQIKYNLIKDTLVLLNVNEQTKKNLIKKTNCYERERVTNAKRLIENEQQKQRVREAQKMRDEYELKNLGNYTKIFPTQNQEDMKQYNQFIKAAEKSYFSQNNFIRAQIEESEKDSIKTSSKVLKKQDSQQLPFQKGRETSPLKNTYIEKQITQRLKNSSTEIYRKQMRMSALLNNNLQNPHIQIPPFSSCFPVKKDKNSFPNHNNYAKIAKSISQFDTEEVKNDSPATRMNLTKNLPKIQTKSPIKSSTIQMQKNKYISLSKKKNAHSSKLTKEKQQYQKVFSQKIETKESGAFLTPKILKFQSQHHYHTEKDKGQKRTRKNSSFGNGFVAF